MRSFIHKRTDKDLMSNAMKCKKHQGERECERKRAGIVFEVFQIKRISHDLKQVNNVFASFCSHLNSFFFLLFDRISRFSFYFSIIFRRFHSIKN